MVPLADLHVHLLAAMDDGPRTWEDSLAMCRIAAEEGTRFAAATVHQNERWKDVTPDGIREATARLTQLLSENGVELTVYPSAEVMADVETDTAWAEGRLLSVGDKGRYLLIEMPNNLFVDLRPVIVRLREQRVRVILAHPERHAEFLHETGKIEEYVKLGCLVQVSSGSITDPSSPNDTRALRSWFKRGCVHLLGSDGHSPRRRKPLMAAAYQQVVSWVGEEVANQVCSINGQAVLRGEKLDVPKPRPERTWWLPRLW